MKRGFTLIEMLVVIGIIAILVGVGLNSFSSATKKAQKAHAQELVTNAATALEALYQKDGSWPRRIFANGGGKGKLDKKVAYELAVRHMMTFTYDGDKKETTGADRFGVISPWAQKVVGRKVDKSISETTKVPSGGTIDDHVLRYAVDTEGNGFVDAVVGDETVRIRATAAVWCCGADGKIESFFENGSKSDDVYSWSRQQVVKQK